MPGNAVNPATSEGKAPDAATARAVTRDLLDSAGQRSVVLISHRAEDLGGLHQVVELQSVTAPVL